MPTHGKTAGRVEAFRRAHRVGQPISGRMLRWEGRGLGLVNIQGFELTALIASDPAPGQILHFTVEKLYPDVVLRELHGLQGPSPAALLSEFHSARRLADEALRPAEAELSALDATGIDGLRRAFHRIAAREPRTLLPLAKLLNAISRLNACLEPALGASLSSPNWLMPGASTREMVEFSPGPGKPAETHFFFHLPALGRCEMRLFANGGLRLFAEDETRAKVAAKLLTEISPILTRFDFLGLSPLPSESRAGILARLFKVDLEAPFSFDRRV